MSHILYKEFQYSHILRFTGHTELFITRKFFTKLCLAYMPKINYLGSDTQSLNQHQLLSCDEPFYFLVFPQIVILMAMVVAETTHK